jgi:hypothetical protein
MPGFVETVQETWNRPVQTQDALLRIHVKLKRTAKALRNWRRIWRLETKLGHPEHNFGQLGESARGKNFNTG